MPIIRQLLIPKVPNSGILKEQDEREKERQEHNFNSHHGARKLKALSPGDFVWVTDRQEESTTLGEAAPRSNKVKTPVGSYRRKRHHLILMQNQGTTPSQREESVPECPNNQMSSKRVNTSPRQT